MAEDAFNDFARGALKMGSLEQAGFYALRAPWSAAPNTEASAAALVSALNAVIEYHSSTHVRITGLTSRLEFNGKIAQIIGPSSGARWPVKLASPADAPPILLQPANLRPGIDGDPPSAVLSGKVGR